MMNVLSKRVEHSESIDFLLLSNNNWNFESDAISSFKINHNENNIYLKYSVEESYVRAKYKAYNQPVYEDSCVEFFISFDEENYYNLEFNCIGTILGAYGPDRNNRTELHHDLLSKIKTSPSLGFNKIEIVNRKTKWTLDIEIPIEVFYRDRIGSFGGLRASGNFYKCGDKLAKPHYLSWSPILSLDPNFHLPEYFGTIEFE